MNAQYLNTLIRKHKHGRTEIRIGKFVLRHAIKACNEGTITLILNLGTRWPVSRLGRFTPVKWHPLNRTLREHQGRFWRFEWSCMSYTCWDRNPGPCTPNAVCLLITVLAISCVCVCTPAVHSLVWSRLLHVADSIVLNQCYKKGQVLSFALSVTTAYKRTVT
jgi:hypothetical protein